MSTIRAHDGAGIHRPLDPTPASMWLAIAQAPVTDEFLDWPPDLFALTDTILARSEAYRFALSPPEGARWPPGKSRNWSDAVETAGRQWAGWADDRSGAIPDLLAQEWRVFRDRAEALLRQLAEGGDWRACEALLTLHAIADEACAGLGVALDRSDGQGCVYRARGRELLARTGSLSRIHSAFVRVLPKVRTPPNGTEFSAFSRYACVTSSAVASRWYKMPVRHAGADLRSWHANLLLLPWPLRVRASDFRPVEGSVQRLADEPFGSFQFNPERLDLGLLDRLLAAARDEADSVDGVVLPESAVDEGDIGDLEALLDRHGVIYLLAGVRQHSQRPDGLAGNYVHTGVNPRLEKGGPPPTSPGGQWFHIRQSKHHRWSLDETQVDQYHLGGALHPRIRWWEAMDVPPRTVQFVEVGELMALVSLVCEDLAQSDNVAQIIRSVGPTLVVTPLLDGPQLRSRWSARYAGVFADDPGSAVLTLTCYGMVQRSRPHGHGVSPVVALWKDPAGGAREIQLEPGAQAVLLTACADRASRRSADGRWPAGNATDYFDVAVYQVRAPAPDPAAPASRPGPPPPRALDAEDLTILTGWAEGAAEALANAPERALDLLAEARPGAPWRTALGLTDPPPRASEAVTWVAEIIQAATPASGQPAFETVLAAAKEHPPGEDELHALARRVLRISLEQLRARQAREATDH